MSSKWSGATKINSKGARYFGKIEFPILPERLADIASDAANNLRSSLDRTSYATAIAGGKSKPTSAYFPFADSESKLEGVIKRRCKHLPDYIVALFRKFKPYKGGNNLLWAMNRIVNTNKHCLLVPVTFAATNRSSKSDARWNGAKHEIVYTHDWQNPDAQDNLHFSIEIVFDKIDVVRGKPAVGVLREMASQVQNIIELTELAVRNSS